MKRVVISVSALLLCILFVAVNTVVMEKKSLELLSLLDGVEELYYENRENAVAKYERFFDKFSSAEHYFCISLNHEEIDILREAVAKTYSYIKTDEAAEFEAELYALKRLLSHTSEIEKPLLGHIL